MATFPSLEDFRARFPSLADAPDETVDAAIKRAPLFVRSSFPQEFIDELSLLQAAHFLTMEGIGTGDMAAFAAARKIGIRSAQDGPTKIEFQPDGAATGADSFSQTSYGREFKEIIARISPRAMIV